MIDQWLPRQYEIEPGLKTGKTCFSGDQWQIIRAGASNVLLVKPLLADKWLESHLLIEGQLKRFSFGDQEYFYVITEEQYSLSSVETAQDCLDYTDAISFAVSYRETRKILPDVSLHDAIYLEKYSRLLPTWTLTAYVDDATVLGYWLTCGVIVSTNSFRRLCSLLTWLDTDAVSEIIQTAGLDVHNELDGNIVKSYMDIKTDETNNNDHQNSVDRKQVKFNNSGKHFSLPGRPMLEKFFNEQIIDVVFNLEKYKKMGLDFPSAVLLYGPPGSGKTYAVEKLAEFLDWPIHYIDSGSIGSAYIHETSKKISQVFEAAMKTSPSIIIIDEMESFLTSRSYGSESGLHHIEEVAEFLRKIPEATKNNVLVFAMTNMLDMIDPAVVRRGRFDHKIEVSMPSKDEVTQLLNSLILKLPVVDNIDLSKAIKVLTGRPFSDLSFAMREAGRIAALNDKDLIDQESLNLALSSFHMNNQDSKKIGFN